MNATSNSTVAPGTILAGKYRVAKVLGQGGMGVVCEAQHIQLEDRVALKFLLPEYATHPEASERFLREARAAVRIKSEHVARVSDVGTLDSGSPYMVMEFLEGDDLSNILVKRGPLPLSEAVGYLIQACEAIHEAHGYGIVHRDIKPANLFVAKRKDGSPLVKVLDFGISKTTGAGVDGLTRTTATMGSALYMSPEQMRQSKNVDLRTDIYAMGITLYELLAGKQPFYANTLPELCAEVLTGNPTPLRDVRNDLPPEFAMVLERAYARSLEHRYQSVPELVFALAPYAPSSSQEIIDRFARMTNTAAPRAGQPGPVNPIVATQIGTYNPTVIPQSGRVTEAFANGNRQQSSPGYPPALGSTGNSSITAPIPQKSSSGGAVLAIIAVLGIGVLGGGYYLKTRASTPSSTPAGAATSEPTSTKTAEPAKADATTAATAPVQTATATAAAPTASAEPVATSDTTSKPASTASQTHTNKPVPVAVQPPPVQPPPPPIPQPPPPTTPRNEPAPNTYR